MNSRIVNAKITSTMLGIEDHNIMTFSVCCEWKGGGCCLGGYALDSYDAMEDRKGDARSIIAVRKIIETVGVDRWEQLKGQLVRVKDNGPGSTLDCIGHIMEDRWFNIKDFFASKEQAA